MENAMSRILVGLTVLLLGTSNILYAQDRTGDSEALSARERSIVLIASHAATGDLEPLASAFHVALDTGLTINEAKEVLLQLAAYCGFPRSLQGINTLMAVLEDRTAQGIEDAHGPMARDVSDENRYAQGARVLEALTGRPQHVPRSGYAAFFPTVERFLKEHLFADIFGRGVLSFRDRELTTVAALVSMGGVEPYARAHMRLALNVGVTPAQLEHLVALIASDVGEAEGQAGRDLLSAALAARGDADADEPGGAAAGGREAPSAGEAGSRMASTPFPRGRRIANDRFTGSVWVEMLVTDEAFGARVGNVTFEPGARTNWHSHPGGQILLITDGAGYYQEQGGRIQLLRPGDVVEIRPDVVHWHGATPSSALAHLAVVTNSRAGATVWLQPVTDEEYYRFW
jgi:quercetin dioxygenase-like cupin family protein/alkylhydroperoxidase/carboxymuconolactone decarboxylase family protein YurZ